MIIGTENPYSEVAGIIMAWADDHYRDDFIVTLEIDGRRTTQFLEYDACYDSFVWFNDWYEGEKSIVLVGFAPMSEVEIEGFPKEEDEP